MGTNRVLAGIALAALLGGDALAGPGATPPAEIPFALEKGDIVVEAEFVPGKPLPFIFDSGLSDGNLVSVEAARSLGLKPEKPIDVRNAQGGSGGASLTHVPRVRVGPVTLENPPAAIAPIPATITARDGKPPLAGFIGAPLMQAAVLCLDYQNRQMRRWRRDDFSEVGLVKTPMPLRHGLPTMDVTIDGRPASLVVDTGSNGAITLFPSFGIVPPPGAEAEVVVFADGSGFNHVPLSAGAQALDPAWGIDGLVGSAVLSQLEPCLDRDGQQILWKP